MRAEVAKLAPQDVLGYERFMRMSEAIYKVGFEQLGHVPFNSWTDMARIIPDAMKLGSYRSVYGLVARYVSNSKLRTVLSFHPLLIGGNPFTVTSIYALIAWLERRWGVHFVMGGTGKLVQGLVKLIEGQGGQVLCNQGVSAITVRNRTATGVRLESGEEVAADVVISNADSASTYGDLLPAAVRKRWSDRRIGKAEYSMSLFVWYFGTKRRYDNVGHHTILLGPRYRGLLTDIFKHKRLAADFSLYLHRPTATDASLAPPGCDAFYVLSPVPNLQGEVDWLTAAEPYRRAIAQHLSATLLPGFESQIVTSRLQTPLDFQERLQSFRGAAFAMEPLLTQSAWFRPHNRSEDIDHLYLVGAGTHPGAGVPGVLSSARILDAVIPDACAVV
jgi:phytoene desaturase